MPLFSYTARDTEGKLQKGLVEAGSAKHAATLLHEKKYFIIHLNEARSKWMPFTKKGIRVSFSDQVHFTRQLATMITAGLTLAESLEILEQQLKRPSLLRLVSELEDAIQGGKSFAEALSKYPQVFSPVYLALIRAGEASGKLDVILLRLAENLEKTRDFRNKVRGALIYPAVIIIGMVVVTVIILSVVVPRMTSLYREFGFELPLPTQILIAVSSFVIKMGWLLGIAGVLALFLFLKWRKTEIGQKVIETILLSLPIFGPLIAESTVVEITRTLAILIDGGVPILTSLQISKDATENILYKEAFTRAQTKIEKGLPLSESFLDSKMFPPILSQMVAIGEQTGKLGESLFRLSRYFETEADAVVRSLTTLIEPLVIVILGVGVGFLVMAVLLPIYSLTSKF